MDQKTIIRDLERRAGQVGLSINDACRQAGIAPITFRRWRSGGHTPTLGKLTAIERVIVKAEKARETRAS